MIFKRKIYAKMRSWKMESDGRSALLIEGARRVGKSTIAEEFAAREYESYIAIDFSDVTADILALFDHVADREYFFSALQTLTGKRLVERKSVIILDEVQLCPKARQAIKHLVKDGRYDYIETGSLLSIKKNVKDIVIPSEEHRIAMYPMDFEEFLWATGKAMYFDFIRDSFSKLRPVGDAMHRSFMKEFRLYMLVGGMPQSVEAYLRVNDFMSVDRIKRNILHLYMDDFRKIDPSGRASTIFSSIPAQLARGARRYMIGNVIEGARPSRSESIFADLEASKTVNFAYHADNPSIGMALHADFDYFKLFMGDTGLFITMAFMDRDFTDNEIYRKLLVDKLPTDLGYVYENIVAQQLRASGNQLFYYTFRKSDDEGPRYEIDFLTSRRDKLCPIEVKSSGYVTHKSLDEFKHKFSHHVVTSYLLYTKDLRKDGNTICLPLYMAGLL